MAKAFVFKPPAYDVIADYTVFHKIHGRKDAVQPLPEPVRAPSPPRPPPRHRSLPTVGFIMKPEETLVVARPENPFPPPPPPPTVYRLKPQMYSLTETLTLAPPPPPSLSSPPRPPSIKPEENSFTETSTLTLLSQPPETKTEERTKREEKEEQNHEVVSSPPAEIAKMMLHEYCMTLVNLNYHSAVTTELLKHVNGLNADPQYRPNIILLTGKSGVGKTFCVQRVCQMGGYDFLEMDCIQTDPEEQTRIALTTRPDPFGPNRDKRICVALFDAIDGMEKERRTAVTRVINTLAGDERAKGKRRSAIRFRVNLVILTVDDRYDPCIRDMVYKLKPTEIKVNELNFDQRVSLVEKSCTYLGKNMSARIYRLVTSNHDNTSSLLTKVESTLTVQCPDEDEGGIVDYSKEDEINVSMKTDDRSLDIFSACRILLKPPETMNRKTSQYETINFANYEETWNLGGDKVINTLFNSYPNFVHYIPETPAAVRAWVMADQRSENVLVLRDAAQVSMKDIVQAGNYFYRGVESMAALSDGFSLMDSMKHVADDSADDVIKRTFFLELKDVVGRNSQNPQIDVKSHHLSVIQPPCLYKCSVKKEDDDKFRFISMMRHIEAQRQIADFTYQPNPHYDLAQHVGMYRTRSEHDGTKWFDADMFADERIVKKVQKRKAGDAGDSEAKSNKITPKMECIKLYSHRFLVSGCHDYVTEILKPAAKKQAVADTAASATPTSYKLMIRLSDGTFVERKSRDKKR